MVLRLKLMCRVNSQGIDLGDSHTCGFFSSSEVKCWGYNIDGELGDGTTKNRTAPVSVLSVSGVKAVSAGGSHTCVLLVGSTVQCWGWNSYGQLGDGSTTDRS